MYSSNIQLSQGFDLDLDPSLLVSQVPLKKEKRKEINQLRKVSIKEVELKLTHFEGILSQHHVPSIAKIFCQHISIISILPVNCQLACKEENLFYRTDW